MHPKIGSIQQSASYSTDLYKDDPVKFVLMLSKIRQDTDGQEKTKALIKKLYKQKEASSTTKTKNRGDVLEDLGHHLLETSGFFQSLRSNSKGQVHELDHACEFNDFCFGPLSRGILKTPRVLGESKNYKDEKIDVNILYKVGAISHFQDFSLAIIFSRKGITGRSSSLSAAIGVASKYRYKKEVYILVFDDGDYNLLLKYPACFNYLLDEKLQRYFDQNDYKINYDAIEEKLKGLDDLGWFKGTEK